MSGYLPPGVTQDDIDRAHQGDWWDEPEEPRICKTCRGKGVIECGCRLITCDECMAPDEERAGVPCPDCSGVMDADDWEDWDGREADNWSDREAEERAARSMDIARHHYRG